MVDLRLLAPHSRPALLVEPAEPAPFRAPRSVPTARGPSLNRLPDSVILDICALADIVLIVAAAMVAKFVYIEAYLGQGYQGNFRYLAAGLVVGTLAYAQMRRQGVYDADRLTHKFVRVRKIGMALLTAVVIGMLASYLFKWVELFSRAWLLLWLCGALAGLVIWHQFVASYLRSLIRSGRMGRNIAVIGTRSCIDDILGPLRADPAVHVALRFAFDEEYDQGQIRDRPGLKRFAELAQQQGVDDVVIAVPMARYDVITSLAESLSHLSSDVRLFDPNLSGRVTPLGTSHLSGVTLFDLQRKPLSPWSLVLKASFDRVAAALALVALMPVFAATAAAIKLDSPGPVLFRQRRAGLDHKVITVLKFRTMRVTEDGPEVTQARKGDARITRVGRWLRRTSLDELPQLINVLVGDMSLVGPRPHALAHNEQYSSMLERYASRHRVKSGLTGWAQINGYRGSTQDPELMRKRVEHDLYYIDNWSFLMDLKILALTPVKGLFNENAY
jgi:putative colanic acid biosynthesis UDP-glucose lipid carrier transferase